MKVNKNEYFIEILAEEGKELYSEELDIVTNRVTFPLNADYSSWIERDIKIEDSELYNEEY